MFCSAGILSFVVRGVWMLGWIDAILLSAVDSALLTDFLIINSLLGHDAKYAKDLLSFVACFFDRTSLLVTSFFSPQCSP